MTNLTLDQLKHRPRRPDLMPPKLDPVGIAGVDKAAGAYNRAAAAHVDAGARVQALHAEIPRARHREQLARTQAASDGRPVAEDVHAEVEQLEAELEAVRLELAPLEAVRLERYGTWQDAYVAHEPEIGRLARAAVADKGRELLALVGGLVEGLGELRRLRAKTMTQEVIQGRGRKTVMGPAITVYGKDVVQVLRDVHEVVAAIAGGEQ
jgi:hypothetical protein